MQHACKPAPLWEPMGCHVPGQALLQQRPPGCHGPALVWTLACIILSAEADLVVP